MNRKLKNIITKKLPIKLFLGFLTLFNSCLAITVQVPTPGGQRDLYITGPTQVEANEKILFEFIQIVNKYGWFVIGAVMLVVMVIAGTKIIVSNGDGEIVKKNAKMVGYALIGIFIAVFSYVMVRLVVNLF